MEVCRGILKAKHRDYEHNLVTFEAFLRQVRDADGVSIGETAVAVLELVPNAAGMAYLAVTEIQGIATPIAPHKLDVIFDAPPHGYIHRVPFCAGEDTTIAEQVAGDLARIATLMQRSDFQRLKTNSQSRR